MVIKQYVPFMEGKSVIMNTDNKNVETILKVASRKENLQTVASDIIDTCQTRGIEVIPIWIPRDQNKRADELSRRNDCDDWGIQSGFMIYCRHNLVNFRAIVSLPITTENVSVLTPSSGVSVHPEWTLLVGRGVQKAIGL